MRIGELSKQSGVSVDALRYYEKQGLLETPPRSTGGYREYPDVTLQFLKLIHNAKAVGFTLKECRNLLAIFHHRDEHTCADVKALAEQKLEELQQQMKQLELMHNTLQKISDACCGGVESAIDCTILDALEGTKNDKGREV